MNDERIWLLLSLQLSGEANPEEIKELETLLKEHPGQTLRAEILCNLWNVKKRPDDPDKAMAFDRHLQRLSNHLSEPALQYENNAATRAKDNIQAIPPVARRGKYTKILWAVSVAASLIIGILLIFPANNDKQLIAKGLASNVISTRPGSKSKVQLPDGSQVLLNANSTITYKNDFLGDIREVSLSGEAFFDVVKDKSKPFVIHTGSIDIKVLGTSFNVRSYPNEKTTETALIRGSVEILLHNDPDKKYILRPNEKLVVNNSITKKSSNSAVDGSPREERQIMTLSKIYLNSSDDSSNIETRWTKDMLDFDGVPFAQIVTELERLYHVQFILKNEKLKKLRFTGGFNNKSLDEVMEALRLSGQFNYEFENGTVTVW
ncbi:MAG: FecR domain-containing protein [Ferruginibacter sp.]|nr:FecR domain-containing protein [Ferruginibacter sp.]